MYILPCVIVLFVLTILPLLYDLYLSLTNYSAIRVADRQFVGLQNYIDMFGSKSFYLVILRTLLYVVGCVTIETVLGFALALIFQANFRFKKILRSIIILPMVATPIAVAYLFRVMYNVDDGVLNYFITSIGLSKAPWTSNANTALLSCMLVDIWQWTPFVFIIICSGMTALPLDPFESATIDGASFWQCIFKIMMPLLKPIMMVAVLFRTVDCLKTFDIIYVLTGGGPGDASETATIRIYLDAFRDFYMGKAATLGIIMIILITIICNIMIKKGHVSLDA